MKRKNVMIISGIVLFLLVIITLNIVKSKSGSTVVKAVKLKKGMLIQEISLNGDVEEGLKRELYIDTPIKIKKVLVKEGDFVKKGQKLFEVDIEEIANQVDQALANYNLQNYRYEETKSSLNLKVSQVISNFKQAEQELEDAKSNLENLKSLYDAGAISLLELKNAEKRYENAQSQYKIAEEEYYNYVDSTGKLSSSNYELQMAKEQLNLAYLQYQEAKKKLDDIKYASESPIDGVVAVLNVSEGAPINPSVPVAVIIDPSSLIVKANISQYDYNKIKLGQEVEISTDMDYSKYKGRVSFLSPTAKTSGGSLSGEKTFELNVEILDRPTGLVPGFTVTVKIISDKKENAVYLPIEAIQEDKDGNKWVYKIERDNTIKKIAIKTGIISDLNVEIVDGLKEGDVVVYNPSPTLKDGIKVKISEIR